MKLARLSLFIVINAFLTGSLFAQERSRHCSSMERNGVSAKGGHEMTPEDRPDEQKRVMNRQERIMSDMRALDTQLQRLISKMNAAEGSEKTDAMADVVNELVWQRTEIHEEIIALQADIMSYMGNHMGTETSHRLHSAQDCPMMQSMTEHAVSESRQAKESAHKH